MSRLIVVSNRVQDSAAGPGAGGLAVALGEALEDNGGVWIGWDGRVEPDPLHRVSWNEHKSGNLTLLTTSLTPEEHEGYYLGFANRVLWPAFHYRLDLVDDAADQRDALVGAALHLADLAREFRRVERHKHLLERMPRQPRRKPGPERPGGIGLVADHQFHAMFPAIGIRMSKPS